MILKQKKLLVMTALEETWGGHEPVIFLGEWCKLYERRDAWLERSGETIQFHWDDRDKLTRDYDYLASLHRSLLASLTRSLNKLHRVDYSIRYWQILLDPWLMTYVGVIFDRWECLRTAFVENNNVDVIWLEDNETTLATFSYAEFVAAVAYSDEWNQRIYQRIIKSEYSQRCLIKSRVPFVSTESRKFDTSPKQRQSIIHKIALYGDYLLGKLSTNYKVIFLGATFRLQALIGINLSIGQIARPFCYDFGSVLQPLSGSVPRSSDGDRSKMQLDFQPSSAFERFVKQWILHDIPYCLVEDYSLLRERAKCKVIKTKAVVTGSSHWGDAFAKMWIAEQVNEGVKLVILEHGGSLPPYKELFNFEADISDARVNWFLPYHPKHVQLPPAKIVGRYTNWFSAIRKLFSRKRYCSVIGNESPRWVFRAQFYPMAYQWSTSFNMILALYSGLDEDIKECFRIKPYPNQGWNTWQRFSDILGSNKVFSEKSLDRVYFASRVIVCSYPETTFSEAMASGVPTILIYPEHLYKFNPIALPLMEILIAAKIVFHDPIIAAAHLNSIWAAPNQWWNSSDVLHARDEFYRQALEVDRNWLKKWTAFLKAFVEKTDIKDSYQ